MRSSGKMKVKAWSTERCPRTGSGILDKWDAIRILWSADGGETLYTNLMMNLLHKYARSVHVPTPDRFPVWSVGVRWWWSQAPTQCFQSKQDLRLLRRACVAGAGWIFALGDSKELPFNGNSLHIGYIPLSGCTKGLHLVSRSHCVTVVKRGTPTWFRLQCLSYWTRQWWIRNCCCL